MTTVSFSTGGSAPQTPGSVLVNLRDLGGLPVPGGRVRRGVLWRSDDVALAARDELTQLWGLGLRHVIDLRSVRELAATGRGQAPAVGLVHHHLPLTDDTGNPAALAARYAAIDSPEAVGTWYARMFRDRASELVAAMRIIADSDGGVLFHCAAGKDRTGVLAAAVLSVLGAERDTIVADYAATAPNLDAILRRLARDRHAALSSFTTTGSPAAELAGTHPLLGAAATSMEEMLRDLAADGGPTTVLRDAGLTPDLISRLRVRLVER